MGGYVRLCGQDLDEAELVNAVRHRCERETNLLIAQIRVDRETQDKYSIGLEVLSKCFREMILAFLSRRFFGSNGDAVSEVWNETLFRVFARINQYDPDRSAFQTWVFNQARYAALDKIRDDEVGIECASVAAATEHLVDPFEETIALTGPEADAVNAAWKQLTDNQRELIRLRFTEDLSYREIAGRYLGGALPESHVRVYVNRAIGKIRKAVERQLAASKKEVH